MRLQKFLAECSIASRRGSEKLIEEDRVTVNGELATVGQPVDPHHDDVRFDGSPVLPDKKLYIVFNKPSGVVTTAKDTHDRKTVLDFMEGVPARVFPVGRLDMDVTGALLLTNDGEMTNRLAHPKYEIDKMYHVWVKGIVNPRELDQFTIGVELDDGMTAPASVALLKTQRNTSLIRITVHEGRKRLVKRMCAHIGHPVNKLRRVAIGSITTQGLQSGEWRYLHQEELDYLRRITGLAKGR
ncbi:MAG: pseudouridine synthase [Candidatus Hydrogenedentota bacterium]